MNRNTLAVTAMAMTAAGLLVVAQPKAPADGTNATKQQTNAATDPKPAVTIIGGPFACDLDQKLCRATFQVTSNQACTLDPPESVFVDRAGATITETVSSGPATVVAGVPKPVLVELKGVKGLSLGSLYYPGTHGMAIDFLQLTGPVTVQIQLGTFTSATYSILIVATN